MNEYTTTALDIDAALRPAFNIKKRVYVVNHKPFARFLVMHGRTQSFECFLHELNPEAVQLAVDTMHFGQWRDFKVMLLLDSNGLRKVKFIRKEYERVVLDADPPKEDAQMYDSRTFNVSNRHFCDAQGVHYQYSDWSCAPKVYWHDRDGAYVEFFFTTRRQLMKDREVFGVSDTYYDWRGVR